MLSCVASIDQGTSSSRVIIFDCNGRVLASHQAEHTQHYPHPGFVEHDPEQIWLTVRQCLSGAIGAVSQPIKIETIGITNQRETTVVWNKHTGAPYHNAIVWNDNRTGDICNRLSSEHGKDRFRAKTGLPIATYFSASKLVYLLETVPGLRADAEAGNALFGTIDSWLIWKLSGNKTHKTDVTNASRTMLMNLETLQWDSEILKELNIPLCMLPAIHSSNHRFATVDTSSYVLTESSFAKYSNYHGIPITGVLGDQQAALFGQTCFYPGDAKCTYGTGAFLLMNTGYEIVHSRRGLLTTVAYKLENGATAAFALEGSVAYCGSVMQWLRDNLGLLSSAAESEAISNSVADNGGVYFVPAFAGLYAPYWRQDARGIIAGLTAYNTKAHIVRAALEASAFQTTEVVQAMHLDVEPYGLPRIGTMRVDGGMTKNNLLMQFQSDLLEIPLVVPSVLETTALGAAYIAGLGAGLWKDMSELKGLWSKGASWNHKMSHEDRSKLMNHWKKTVARSLGWIDHIHFGSDHSLSSNHSSANVATVMRNNNTLSGSDPFVAKLNDSDPTVDRHRVPSSVPVTPNAVTANAVEEELKKMREMYTREVDRIVNSHKRGRVFSFVASALLLSVGFVSGVAAVYHLKSAKR